MSVIGSGTSSDPYIVETYDDLGSVTNIADNVFIKFADNIKIDLSQEYSGETPYITCRPNLSIDGNGAVLSGYSNSEHPMFVGTSSTYERYFELKNIDITSMYTPNSSLIANENIWRFDHVRISGVIGGKESFIMYDPYYNTIDGWIKQCSFTLEKNTYDTNNDTGRLVIFASRDTRSYPSELGGGKGKYSCAGIKITDTILDISSIVPVIFIRTGGGSWNSKLTRMSRCTIKLNGNTPVYHIYDTGNNNEIDISNTVIRGNSTGVINLPSYNANFTGVVAVDGTSLPNASTSGTTTPFQILTSEQIKDPAYLQSIGFECT